MTNLRKSICGIGNVCESVILAMRDCKKVNQIWEELIPNCIRHNFLASDLQDWIKVNVIVHGTHDNWSSLWAVGYHVIWSWRNQEVHNDVFVRPLNTCEIIVGRMKDYIAATIVHNSVMGRDHSKIYRKVIDAIENSDSNDYSEMTLIRKIRLLMVKHDEVILDHTFQEANYAADELAKAKMNMKTGFFLVDEIPYWIKNQIQEYSRGRSTVRVVEL
ncbi:uncharacterized protein LOC131597386 [Vicia villosa]|uniref:uncharacterized protein LOC131597386 n=1 Tax=Vicia villosa TaxID=3911 RepID=UPI00273AA1BE|nr:uncharacterized protein LOC131597386 [Vicia villosa]